MRMGGGHSIFDAISKDDITIAFFPCIRFSVQFQLESRCDSYGERNWTNLRKLKNSVEKVDGISKFYQLLNKLVSIYIKSGNKLIIENPFSNQGFLHHYFWLKPKVIDYDRHSHGDYFKKPTQYFFINCEPKKNKVKDPPMQVRQNIESSNTVQRSMIHPNYIKWWLESYIFDGDQIDEQNKVFTLFDYL